jgi:hypothetical protein
MTLAELVAEAQLCPPERLAAAARRAHATGEALVAVLVESERVPEEALAAALARALGRAPIARIDEIDDEAVREAPHDLARSRRLCPVAIAAGVPPRLRVAMADPTDREAIADLEHISGCRVEALLAPLSVVEDALRRAYRHLVTAVMKRPAEEAPLELRHRALLELLVEKGLISFDEYARQLRRLAGERE